jgi:D-alanine-D-alanine ligase-like ATP-grasp enzyme
MVKFPGALRSVELGGVSGVWRELVTRLDVASATGIRHALRRLSQDLRHAGAGRPNPVVGREIWTSAAKAVGAEIVELGDGFFEFRKGSTWTRVHEQTVPLNTEVAVRLAEDKPLVYRLLREAGLPVPDHLEFSLRELRHAIEFLEQGPAPCVVKPARGASGFGVTTQIREPADLRHAARWAARFSGRLLIERQADGNPYRLLVLDGTVLDVIRREPPRVTGDGHSTVAELVEAEYERRLRTRGIAGVTPFVIDLDSLLTLRRDGLSPRSVVAAGKTVRVKTVTNQNRAEDNEAVVEAVSSELESDAAAAASVAGLRFAGVDVVTIDPSRALAQSGGVVIDVNAGPGLWHHYRVRERSGATDVAAEILKELLTVPS